MVGEIIEPSVADRVRPVPDLALLEVEEIEEAVGGGAVRATIEWSLELGPVPSGWEGLCGARAGSGGGSGCTPVAFIDDSRLLADGLEWLL